MNLNSKLAREILKNAEEHRLAAPVYVGINKNPKKNTWGEFHIYPEESPIRSVAHLVVSKTAPRNWYGTDPISGCRSFNVPAVNGDCSDCSHRLLDLLLAKHPMAKFVAGHISSGGIRTWGLYFRTQGELARFCKLTKSVNFARCAWLYADEKDRIK